MLSIAKLRVGQEAYHLSGVAQSLDDYYTGVGEAAGQWLGGGAERLGLAGTVDAEDLRAVLAGMQPGTGGLTPNGATINPHPRRVPGFDLTFKAPKSASVLYAVSDDPRVQGAVIEAGESAMRSALGWLEREALQVQRGSHNTAYLARLSEEDRALAGPRRLPTSGAVAAAFRHRTSRAGDPLLHWHVLVANLVEGTDGKWSSFVHPEVYRHARAAGEVFQTVFRAELTRSLGVEWRPGQHVPEIAGIPQDVIVAFSKRSAEIDAWLQATGTPDTIEGRQQAVLATRRKKPEKEHIRFDAEWKAEAADLGWGPEMADGLVASAARHHVVDYQSAWRIETVGFDEDGNPETYERTVTPDEWTEVLLRSLTREQSTFTFADITRAVATTIGAGATVETIERLTRRVIGSDHVVEVHADDQPQQWTSRELADTERRFIEILDEHTNNPVDAACIQTAVATHSTLGDDQRAAVEALCSTTAAVSVLVGPAGTGKTHTLDAIRAACEAAGITMIGAAPSARAALELADATGIDTSTLHRLLATQQQPGAAVATGTVLVIDEAGMADIRTLTNAVTRHVAAGGRVILSGDHHQLPEIGAGGGFSYAAHNAHTVAELTVNRRQHEPWEQSALADLRNGDVAAAVHAYIDHDRLTVADAPGDLVARAIELWAAACSDGLDTVLLAGTNELVDQLNRAAIAHLINTGELADTDQYDYGPASLRIGERVVVRRNSDQEHDTTGATARVVNGHTGTVVAVDTNTITVALDHGPTAQLDERYLRRGGQVTHAYALTTHRAQGGTWDQAIAVGVDTLRREAAYVQLSRGAQCNHLLLTEPEVAELLDSLRRDTARHDQGITHPDDEPDNAERHLVGRISRSAAKHLAHTLDSDIDRIDHLASNTPYAELAATARSATYAEHLATSAHGHHRDELARRLEHYTEVAGRIVIGQSVSPADRNNIGTIVAVDNTAGTATLHFTSTAGHDAERTFDWEDLRFVEPRTPGLRPVDETMAATIEQRLRELTTAIDAWDHTLRSHHHEPGDATVYTRAAARAVDLAASRLAAEQPSWLQEHLGPRPGGVADSRTWDNAVTAIARYHLANPGGPAEDPIGAHQLRTWIAQTRNWLDTTRTAQNIPTMRTAAEVDARRGVLEQVLETAPNDCRQIIDQVQKGQLALTNVDDLLNAALDQQVARRDWILEHWPHIVEYAELERSANSLVPLPSIV